MTASPSYLAQEPAPRPCASCASPLPFGADWRQQYCEPCRQLRMYSRAIERIVAEHPELRGVAVRLLAGTSAKPRRPVGGPRPAWRDERREVYAPYDLWAIVRSLAIKYEVSISAAARWVIRWYGETALGRELYVMDGEIIGLSDDEYAADLGIGEGGP